MAADILKMTGWADQISIEVAAAVKSTFETAWTTDNGYTLTKDDEELGQTLADLNYHLNKARHFAKKAKEQAAARRVRSDMMSDLNNPTT